MEDRSPAANPAHHAPNPPCNLSPVTLYPVRSDERPRLKEDETPSNRVTARTTRNRTNTTDGSLWISSVTAYNHIARERRIPQTEVCGSFKSGLIRFAR